MKGDPDNLYYELGLSLNASDEDIRSVYRALAKIYHPDINTDPLSAEKFKRISAAYEVLSDPKRRSHYDSRADKTEKLDDGGTGFGDDGEATQAIRCSKCGKITAQPRFIAFRTVFSLVFVTKVKIRKGIFCSKCASAEAWKSSLLSSAFGWWALPWGPVLTIREVSRNAMGGQRFQDYDDELSWQNVIAFFHQSQFELALAISQNLRSSTQKEIAVLSERLSKSLISKGVRPVVLKKSWGLRFDGLAAHFLLLLPVPFFLIAILYGAFNNVESHSPINNLNKDIEYIETPVSYCPFSPENNYFFVGSEYESGSGGHAVSFRNGLDQDAIVKIKDEMKNRTVVSIYVRAKFSSEIEGLPDGSYKIQFATGELLDSSCAAFIRARAQEFEGVQRLKTSFDGNSVFKTTLSFTLHAVPEGNKSTNAISDLEFDN